MMRRIKKPKAAQAGVITTILMILIGLALIVVVWNVVKAFLARSSEKIETDTIKTQLEITEDKVWLGGGARVTVKRGVGGGEIEALRFVFEKNDGTSKIVNIENKSEIPKELEIKIIDFHFSDYPFLTGIKRISVAPVFANNIGIQVFEPEAKINRDSEGNRIYDRLPFEKKLVSYWKFEGNADDSAGGNPGNIHGNPSLVAGILGQAYHFDGFDDYIDVGNFFIDNSSFSVSAWFQTEDTAADHRIFARGNQSGNNPSIQIVYGGIRGIAGQGKENYGDEGGSGKVVGDTTIINVNQWYHIVFVLDGPNMLMYLNGTFVTSNTNQTDVTSLGRGYGPFLIGARVYGVSNIRGYFNGTIDELKIWNYALTGSEVRNEYLAH